MSLREDIMRAKDLHQGGRLSADVIELSVESWRTVLRETGFPADMPIPQEGGMLFGMKIRVVEDLAWDFVILTERPL